MPKHWRARDREACRRTGSRSRRRRIDSSSSPRPIKGEESASVLFHAFATNLRFEPDEYNFVRERAKTSTTEAFKSRDEHFEGDES